MCDITKCKLPKRFIKKNKIICYKIVNKKNNRINSPCYSGYIWKPGYNKGSEKCGIFVFSSCRAAKKWWLFTLGEDIIIPVTCLTKDFVGTGYRKTELVFKKVFLSKKDYLMVMK